MPANIKSYRGGRVHFIGVGGSSMSGLAGLLADEGYTVSGSDRTRSHKTDALAARGSYVEVRLREGRNRQVRRMLEAVGHPVIALHREAFGPLVLGDLPRGASRPLAEEEVARLKELAS